MSEENIEKFHCKTRSNNHGARAVRVSRQTDSRLL